VKFPVCRADSSEASRVEKPSRISRRRRRRPSRLAGSEPDPGRPRSEPYPTHPRRGDQSVSYGGRQTPPSAKERRGVVPRRRAALAQTVRRIPRCGSVPVTSRARPAGSPSRARSTRIRPSLSSPTGPRPTTPAGPISHLALIKGHATLTLACSFVGNFALRCGLASRSRGPREEPGNGSPL